MPKTVTRAGIVAGAYMALAGAWIIWSGQLAVSLARSVEELEALERYKGMGFVLVTGVGLFVLTWGALRRQSKDEEEAARAREALLKSERSALAGLFVSSLTHDASNLTMVITSALELLGDGTLTQDQRETLADGRAATERLITLFHDLKQMGSGRGPNTCTETELSEQVTRIVNLLHGHSALKHCVVRVDAPAAARARVFPMLVDQVLINLLLNAADATGGHGTIEVRVRGDGADTRLEVHDDGPGLPKAMEADLFKPFVTTKEHGTGLGLVSVKECARAHGGRVEYVRSPLGGACFSVVLPTKGPALQP